jgi:hypothetical protein
LEKLFGKATRGCRLKSSDRISGNLPFVTAGEADEGVSAFIGNDVEVFSENTITIDMFGSAKYRNYKYGGDDHIAVVHTEKIPDGAVKFITSAIHKTSYTGEFNYGRNFYAKDADALNIQLPIKDKLPDYDFMNSFIMELETERIAELEAYLLATGLKDYELTEDEQKAIDEYDNLEWGEFRLGVLFEKIKTKKLSFKADELPKQIIGKYTLPCLTSSFKNQGLNYFVPKDGVTILKNVISIPSNSDIYRAYFQSNEFTVLSDAYAIRWIFNDVKLLPNQYLFAVQCINKVTDLSIYSYKNKLGGWNVVKNKYIQLPIKNDKPDYEIMDTLISAIQKLVIKDVVLYVERKKKELNKLTENANA